MSYVLSFDDLNYVLISLLIIYLSGFFINFIMATYKILDSVVWDLAQNEVDYTLSSVLFDVVVSLFSSNFHIFKLVLMSWYKMEYLFYMIIRIDVEEW